MGRWVDKINLMSAFGQSECIVVLGNKIDAPALRRYKENG